MLTHLNDALTDMARTHGKSSQLKDHFDPKQKFEGLNRPI